MWLVVEFYYSQLLAVSLVCSCGTPCSRNLEESAIMHQGDGFMVVVTEHVVFVSLSGIGIEHSACGVYHGGTGSW